MFRFMPFALIAAPAFAQSSPAPLDAPQPTYIYPKETHIDLTGADVTATTEGPSIGYAFEPAHNGFNPLIRLRANFEPEMMQSLDQVR